MFNLKQLTKEQKQLRSRILKISYDGNHTHLGSCLSSIDAIDAIYDLKKKDDPFILSNGHAGIALYVVLEKHGFIKEDEIKKLNIHPDRNLDLNIYVSSGSLGQGLPIALGMAFANKKRMVYCMISDGECNEGSIWEALRVASDYEITNLRIIVNANGWGAYDPINTTKLLKRIEAFGWKIQVVDGHNKKELKKALTKKIKKPLAIFAKTCVDQFKFLNGQDAHYYKMTEQDYQYAINQLK